MSLPPETIISVTRTRILWLIASPLILIACVYLIIKGGPILQYIMAGLGCIVGLLLTVVNYADVGELSRPQLIISGQGISHRNGEQFTWEEIKSEKVIYQGKYHRMPYVSFETLADNRLFNMRDWNIRPQTLINLMRQYRNCYENLHE